MPSQRKHVGKSSAWLPTFQFKNTMAVASWMLRDRTFRSSRSFNRYRSDNEEETVLLDANKDANENTLEILRNICKKQGLTDGKRLAYLNVFTKLIEALKTSAEGLTLSNEQVLCCLKVGLVSNNTSVRAASLRVIRYFISTPQDVSVLNKLQFPNLIARSIDLVLKNDNERVQAFRLSLKILSICPKQFSAAVTRSLISLGNSVNENKDRMIYSCLAILCQLCVLNPELLMQCCGQTTLLRGALELTQPRINECLVGSLLFLLNKPDTRHRANVQLYYLTCIYCELQHNRSDKDQSTFTSSRLSILAALRTWPGVFHLCQPNHLSGIKAIVDVMYIDRVEVRKAILELLYNVFGLDCELLTDDMNAAVETLDPARPQDSWKLTEGFVTAEGKDLLPSKAICRPNLTEIHTALLVYTFLECGLLSALVEIIVSLDRLLSVQAIILLGVILDLAHRLLPTEMADSSPGLGSLVQYVTRGTPRQQMQALAAVSTLHKIHHLLKDQPNPHSLFLRSLQKHGDRHRQFSSVSTKSEMKGSQHKSVKKKLQLVHIKDLEEHVKQSGVFSTQDPRLWRWRHIKAVLKSQCEPLMRLEDVQSKSFVRKLMSFYKPGNQQYSALDLYVKGREVQIYTTTAYCLLDLLLAQEGEQQRLLTELLTDVEAELQEVVSSKNVHDILLSPQRVSTTLSQHYFLLLGHLTNSAKGLRLLDKCGVLQTLMQIVATSIHASYVKLIISSLNYNQSDMTRSILNKALSSPIDTMKVYATELLLVLARCDLSNFHTWGLDLLLSQMYDENRLVSMVSLNAISELCSQQVYLDALINTRPSLLHLGDRGHLLLMRFLSTPTGYTCLSDANFVMNELDRWQKGYNYRYVGLMEAALHDSLTLHQRGDNGRHMRRVSNAKHRWKDLLVYPHLYGELSQHGKGFQALLDNGHIFKMVQVVQNGHCSTDAEILDLKASLWAVSHLATSHLGLQQLEGEDVVGAIVNLAQSCQVLSVRATAFYCLSLVSTTVQGANTLARHGWCSLRRNRSERFPVVETEYLLLEENPLDTKRSRERQDDLEESFSTTTLGSDETDSAYEGRPVEAAWELRSPTWRNKKAATLPLGLEVQEAELREKEDSGMEKEDTRGSGMSAETAETAGSARRTHQRSYSETFYLRKRHSSEVSCDSGDGNQKLSFVDAMGLATLQSLHSSRRPDITGNWDSDLEQPDFRKRFSSQDRSSNSPLSDFEAHNPPRLFSNASSSSLSSIEQLTTPPHRWPTLQGGCAMVYQGLALPRNLWAMMCLMEGTGEKKDERRSTRKRGSLSFSEMEQVKEMEEENETCSSSTDISESGDCSTQDKKTRSSRRVRHSAANCIACCTKVAKGKRQRKLSTGSFRLRTDTESSYGNPNESSPISLQWRLRTRSETAFQNYAGGSGDSISKEEASVDGFQAKEWREPEVVEADEVETVKHSLKSDIVSHARVRREILKHVTRMCNPVWAKASKQSLLQLKQSHPSVFQDVCLYSSVCDTLNNSACRVTARRFIQELFLDLTFVKVYDDALTLLQQYAPPSAGAGLTTDESTESPTPSVGETETPPHLPPANSTVQSEPAPKTTSPVPAVNLSTVYENVATHFVPCSLQVLQLLQAVPNQVSVPIPFNSDDEVPPT